MAYQEGDTSPPHTNVHNDVRTQLDQLSTEFEIPVVLPPVVGLGDVGHVDHHNLFTTALAELSKHECEEGLPGLGGWATIEAVSGTTTTRYEYNDGVTDWVAYEWTDDGTVSTTDGLIDVLLAGGGGWGRHAAPTGGEGGGNGATLVYGIFNSAYFGSSPHAITIGEAGDPITGLGKDSTFGPIRSNGGTSTNYSGNGGDGAGGLHSGSTGGAGLSYAISGTELEYAAGGNAGSPQKNPITYGSGAGNGVTPGAGVVIVRVPAAYAQSVVETFHGWDSFALVNDGVVTEVTKVPDNEPHTLDAEWLPCDAEVQAGWSHADGEFTPPPAPTRDDLIAELKARIKDLQKDKK